MKKSLLWITITLVVISMAVVFGFSGCAQAAEEATAAESAGEAVAEESAEEAAEEESAVVAEDSKVWKIVDICHQPHVDFFVPVQVGVQDFVNNVWGPDKVQVDWTGPLPGEWSVEKQIEIIEASIPVYDAIITTAPDPVAFNGIIEEAKNAGLPVILYNADAPDSMRDAFVGQDRFKAGQGVALEAVKYADENMPDRGEGEIQYLYSICFAGHSALEEVINGYRSVLDNDPRFVSVVDPYITTTNDPIECYSAFEDALLTYPDLDFILPSDANCGIAAKTVLETGNVDQVKVFGVCSSLLTLEMIQQGAMPFVADQNQYLQGYMPMSLLYALFELDMPIIESGMTLDTGYIPITSENIDEMYAMYEGISARFQGE